MAKAMKCDRCGKYYDEILFDHKHEKNGVYKDGRPILWVTIHTFGMEKDLDICPRCDKAFRKFFGENITCLR